MKKTSIARLSAAVCLALPAAWALSPHAVAASAGCMPDCAVAASVFNAAGVPPKLKASLARLRFDSDGLAAGDAAVVTQIAASLKALPAKTVVTIEVSADKGQSGAAAQAQAGARASALQKALSTAGVPAGRAKVVTQAG